MDYLLSTDKLSVGYDGMALIKNICIDLRAGEILTLIGPNGSGKSTILKTLTKYLRSIAGTVFIGGKELAGIGSGELARSLSVVLTQRLKTELMSCGEVVATGRYPYTGRFGILSSEDKKNVAEAMELVGVTNLRERDFSQISDGQRQRVLLARAICQQPKIIVLDEPTSFLDVRYELELLSLLRELAQKRGIAVVMSLHELDLAERVSDKVMCVKGDYITHYGDAREIFSRELIHELYDIQSGSYNPLFGTLELRRVEGVARIFVIAGAGSGIPVYRELQKRRVPFASGVLHENDVDYQVGRELAVSVVAQRAFDFISDENIESSLELLRGCGYVVNCLQEYGALNARNRELLEAARSMGLNELTPKDVFSGDFCE